MKKFLLFCCRRFTVKNIVYLTLVLLTIPITHADASHYVWTATGQYFSTPQAACDALVASRESGNPTSCPGYYFGQPSITFGGAPYTDADRGFPDYGYCHLPYNGAGCTGYAVQDDGGPLDYRISNISDPVDFGKTAGPSCTTDCGNPINVGIGNKHETQNDLGGSIGTLAFERYYNAMHSMRAPNGLGAGWSHTYDRTITNYQSPYQPIRVGRSDGKTIPFWASGTTWTPDADITDTLTEAVDGSGNPTGYTYHVALDNSIEQYDGAGKLLSITSRNGQIQTLTYSTTSTPATIAPKAGLLINVSDLFNHQLSFTYDNQNRVATMTDPNGGVYHYAYDAYNNLALITYPDGKTRTYIYNEPANTANTNLPNALTGIVDENSNRFATWTYDSSGRAISSEHDVVVGSTTTPVEKVSIAYTTDSNGNVTSSAVTDALNTTRTYSFTNILGVVKNTGVTQPCNSGCGAASATSYDANGNIASRTDFNGNITNYVYDLTRNLETSRTEAYGTPQARTITTTWNPTYRLPATITESGKLTTFTYDTSGNLLSKTITDTALNKSRTWTYTYNSLGQVLTADGPRTDVSDVTTYTYYSSASSTSGSVHSIGDLATVTNALGQVTSITNYDLNGRPLSITDPNNVVTTLTYSPRGWLKTRTVGVQTTQYDYDNVGQLIKVTLPDASYLSYTYDTAHRLTDITDNAGNNIHYTLDAMGNRTQEDTKDPSNNILKTRSRIFDSLNRLQKDIGGTSPTTQITQYGYDNNGNLTAITDPLNHITTNGYDALNRLISVTDPANGVSTTTYNALDQITSVADPRLVTTNYTINALGDVALTQSPDSGSTTNIYDAAGNITQKTDARGVVSNYTYDALNRLTSITYPASTSENVTFTYDDTNTRSHRMGRLKTVTNASGSITLSYDVYGNITTIADSGPVALGVSTYQYDSANRLKQIMYPSGRIVTYTRNALGQIIQVQAQDAIGSAVYTIISNATYEPFGPLKSLTFGNGVTTTIQHDADYRVGRITTTSIPAWDYVYSYDAASNLSGMADQIGTANKAYGYDALNRLVTDNNTLAFAYQYDVGGNRTLRTVHTNIKFPQTYAATSNQMTSFSSVATPSDAAGNLTARNGITALTYNNADRLNQATVNTTATTYQYSGLGQRNLKTGAQTIHYDYLPDGKYLNQTQLNADNSFNTSFNYIWLDDIPVAQIKTVYTTNNAVSSTRLTYIHADHLNTPRLMTDSTQKVVWSWNVDAYGQVIPNANPDGDSITDTLDLRFPGQIADNETGLFYNVNRYYDPFTGRYTQPDIIGPTRNYSDPVLQTRMRAGIPLKKGKPRSIGLNQPYAYTENNPVKYVDPFGLENGDIIPPGSLDHWNTGDASVYPSNYVFPPPPKVSTCELVCSVGVGKGCLAPAKKCPGPPLAKVAAYGVCEVVVEVGCRFVCDKIDQE